ncbi:recombination mediator RecR [Conchiformibius steedae]|uniref:recombination mediator RecR n=1 Tax=Conchiformibius steedae TaxID=153493 RepID=UPI0026ED7719|nr:recombination mediator RecR [Conchiformibius steedae]
MRGQTPRPHTRKARFLSPMDAFNRLIKALCVLPNVGPKTAQRMAHALLQQNRAGADELAQALQYALKQINHCADCNTFCEGERCSVCADATRDPQRLMIVSMPADVAAMEAANCHDGVYFVLMGQINPIQNMDLHSIALERLIERLSRSHISEIIIATAATAEGDATAYVLIELLKSQPYRISRLARGMPLGSEIEYVDAGTLAQAVYERKQLNTHNQHHD